MPTVTLPDSTEVEFPDSMSAREIEGELLKAFPALRAGGSEAAGQEEVTGMDGVGGGEASATTAPLDPYNAIGRGMARQAATPEGAYLPAFEPFDAAKRVIDAAIPSFQPETPEMQQVVDMMGLGGAQRAAATVSEKLRGALGSVASPGGVVLGAAAPFAPELVGPVVGATVAPQAIEGVKELARGDIAAGAMDVLLTAPALVGGAAELVRAAPRLPSVHETLLPGASETFKRVVGEPAAAVEVTPLERAAQPATTAEGEANASSVESAAAPVRDVLRSDEGGTAQASGVPQGVDEGGEGVRSNADQGVASPEAAIGSQADAIQSAVMQALSEGGMVQGLKKGGDASGHYVVMPPEEAGDAWQAVGPFKDRAAAQDFLDAEVGAPGAKVVEVGAQGRPLLKAGERVAAAGEKAAEAQVGAAEGEAAVPPNTPTPESTGEPTPPPPSDLVPQKTGIKNARLDQQALERGDEPIMATERKADTVLWDQAMEAIDREPGMADRLTRELLEAPRPLSDVETVVMTHRIAELRNELDQAHWEGSQAGDLVEKAREEARLATTQEAKLAAEVSALDAAGKAADAEARAAETSAKLSKIDEAVGRQPTPGRGGAGAEAGRALRARQLLMREDYSYAGLERQMRAANGFKPLTVEQAGKLRAIAEEVKAKNIELAARVRELEGVAQKAQAARELAQLREMEARAQAAVSGKVKTVLQKVGDALDKQADAARARLRGKVLSLSPEDLADITRIAAANLFHIGEDVARWTAKMVEEFGEGIKPHLEELLKAARAHLEGGIKEVAGATGTHKSERAAAKTAQVARDATEIARRRLKARIADYEARIAKGDFASKERAPAPNDPETIKLMHELDQVKRRFHELVIAQKMAKRSAPQKIFGSTVEGINAMRAVLTSADLSAVLRQGKMVVLAHPLRATRSIVPMLKAFASERAAFAVEHEIANRPNYPLYRASKLYLSEHGFSLSKMEEAYMSRWAGKLPGVGPMVKASERAYTTFLNKLRADSFDAMKASLGRGGAITIPEARILANYINVATGRGTLGMADQAAVGLNTVFFAPRFVASRFQMLLGQPLYYGVLSGKAPLAGTARARAMVAGEYARILAGAAAVYTLGSLAGAQINADPRSSDFGKMRFGNTRIDPMAGLNQVTVLLSRLASGEKRTLKGKLEPIRGKVPYGGQRADDVIKQFARMKLAPAPGVALDLVSGKDVVGNKVTPGSELAKTLVPISLQDIYSTMKEQDVPAGTAISLLSLFGEGVQNYDANAKRP